MFRNRLTYANVTASLALFIALGGGAYAATQLPKDSVGTAQIKKNAVTGAKIKSSAVSSSDVKNGSLLAADFAGGQLPSGAQGATGPAGPKGDKGDAGTNGTNGTNGTTGPRGPSNVYADRNDTSTAITSNTQLASITVPAGKYIVMAKTVGANDDNNAGDEARIGCTLVGTTAGTIDQSLGGAEDNTRFDDFTVVSLLSTLDSAAGDTLTLSCQGSGADPINADNTSLVAIQTESLTLSP